MEVPGSAILDVATSPDGRLLAAGHVDGEITVWQLEDMTMLARLRGHASRVASVEFSSDGAWLVSGSWDGTLRQWAVRPMLADPVELGRELEAAWGMGVDAALRR